MTGQIPVTLRHEGRLYDLQSDPLKYYLSQSHAGESVSATDSTCIRGYVGNWEVESDRLYLTALSGQIDSDGGLKAVGLADLFPEFPDGVFAHWFSGELRCTYGMRIVKSGENFSRLHSHDMFLQVRRGVVISERHVELGSPPASTQAETDQLMHALSKWTD